MFDLVLSLVMLAAAFTLGGAIVLLRKGDRKRGVLMLVLAVVMLSNVAIWLVPEEGGGTPAERAAAVE